MVSYTRVRGVNSENVTILLTGDVMLGRSVMTKSLDLNDPTYPFKNVSQELKSADLVFVNLENPIIDNCPRRTDGMIFCALPRMIEGLTYAGIDVANLANNHTLNYGADGKSKTTNFLTDAGISSVGYQNLVVKNVGGTKFGFMGFEFIDSDITETDMKLVRDANLKVDVLIVAVHWGSEYQATANIHQRTTAKKLIESGADVIAGSHPHWVQDIEYIDGKPVYYSLGNFVFDQMWSEKTRQGLAIKLTFNKNKIVSEEKLPIYMRNWAQPEWVQ